MGQGLGKVLSFESKFSTNLESYLGSLMHVFFETRNQFPQATGLPVFTIISDVFPSKLFDWQVV